MPTDRSPAAVGQTEAGGQAAAGAQTAAGGRAAAAGGAGPTVYYVCSDSLGSDPEIGRRLAQSFWNTFHERLTAPATFAFTNRGVLLTLDDSPVLAGLRGLLAKGCTLYSCGTCLDYFGARDRLAIGEVGSIPLLQELMDGAVKVVTL